MSGDFKVSPASPTSDDSLHFGDFGCREKRLLNASAKSQDSG